MDTNIEKRVFPLPYPETPSVADWHAEHAECAAPQAEPSAGEHA